MATPTWGSLAEAAINKMPTWEKHFAEAGMLITFRLKVASVEASGWALGKTMQEIESEAARRLQEGE
ncbi:MAG: hypothetical protein DYG89_15090 [Caldilinea sp. CFX5]|nr:hypothetical protein [Caldilinea sp. CFX5]